jgi:hypothetical protein
MLKNLVTQYPLIKIDITVIDRQHILDKIQLVGDELNKPVYLWSLLQPDFQPLSTMGASLDLHPAITVIKSIGSLKADTSGLYVFENLFAVIDAVSPLEREGCYQAISQLFARLNQQHRECLIIFMESGRGNIPSFLNQIIWEYKFPLPTNFELTTLLLEHGINLTQSPRLFNILAGLTVEEITVGIRANRDVIADSEALGDRLLNVATCNSNRSGLQSSRF